MPNEEHDIDFVLRQWPFKPGVIAARLIRAGDGRELIQMRIEMGLLQMETAGRPDGEHPGGVDTCLDWLRELARVQGKAFALNEEQCMEIDREFVQFYHRRICYLALRQFARAIADAEYTLQLMDFVAGHSPNPQWALSHEQYRPFVLFHRIQAAAMLAVEQRGAEAAIETINRGLNEMREVFAKFGAEEQFDGDELVGQLAVMKESLREEYRVGKTLAEQLADAVAAEEYERAARLRDEIAKQATGNGISVLRRLAQRFGLVELVVERLDADAELFGGLGLVAVVAVERLADRLHLPIAEVERLGGAKRDRRRPAATRNAAAGVPGESAANRKESGRARRRSPARARCPATCDAMSISSASGENSSSSLPPGAPNRAASRRANSGMSSIRSRSGGSGISNVLMRNQRSSRKSPAATMSARSRLVAQITRTSQVNGSLSPTRRTSPLSRNRSSFACIVLGSSPISSRKRLPPLATCNRPMRCSSAPVKAPLRWPNNSLSIRFSGSAPQLIGTSGISARQLC